MAFSGLSAMNITLTMANVASQLTALRQQLQGVASATNTANSALGGMSGGVGKAFGGATALISGTTVALAAAGAALYGVGSGIISTNAEFQKLAVNLEVATGSVAASNEAFFELMKLAKETPYSTAEVTKAFIDLKNLGLDPGQDAIKSYSNTAASLGKSLDQMIQAVADARTGEFERLKEFGIVAKKQGNEIAINFQGTTTKIKNNSEDIEKYLQNIGNTTFGGAGAKQAKTFSAAFGNLTDNIQIAAYTFGKAGFNEGLTNLINSFTSGEKSGDQFLQTLGRISGQGLNALADGVKAGIAAFEDFLDIQTSVGGESATVGQLITASFYTAAQEIGLAFGEIKGVLADMWDSAGYFWSNIAKVWTGDIWYIKSTLVTTFNVMGIFLVGFFKTVSTLFVALPRVFIDVFKVIRNYFVQFGKSIVEFFKGDFGSFDNFWDKIGVQKVVKDLAPVEAALQSFRSNLNQAMENPGELTGPVSAAFNRLTKETVANIRRVKKEGEVAARDAKNLSDYKNKGDGNNGGGDDKASKAAAAKAKRDAEKAARDEERRIEKLQSAYENLTGTYMPVIDRQQKLAEALKNINDLVELGPAKLKKMGISLDSLATITERVSVALNKTFGEKQLEKLVDEADDLAYANDIAGAASKRLAAILRDARDSYEDLTPAEKERLAAQIKYNEALSREKDMRESLKGKVDDINEEIRLLGTVGKERDRLSNLMQVEREARDKGLDPSQYVSQYAAALDRLELETKKFNTVGFGVKSAMTEYAENATNIAEQTKTAVSGIFDSLEDNLTKFIETGKFSFKDFLGSIGSMLAKFAAQQAVLSFMNLFGVGGGGTGVLGSIFGGFREGGGDVQSGKAYVVGEKRPELFVPKTSGTIIPSVPSMGRSGGTTVNPAISLAITLNGDGTNFDMNKVRGEIYAAANDAVNSSMLQMIDEQRHGGLFGR